MISSRRYLVSASFKHADNFSNKSGQCKNEKLNLEFVKARTKKTALSSYGI